MLRIAIGIFILFGAVGHEDMMMELNQPQPLLPFMIKAVIGIAFVAWGVYGANKKGLFRDEY